DLVFALCQSWNALPSSTITSSWKKLWPDIVANTTNDPQISVPSEVIEQIAAETQISPNDKYTPQVTAEDAINAFELGLQWAEANGASYKELLLLRRLRDKALISRFNNVKQKEIDEYFHAC
ncbi:hypothetical protein WA026_002572, partial [Henosepilachna vigintioctopunctata]